MVWVKFHDKLCKGAKRGLPRAVRFVFMELCLEARPGRGVMSLPVGMPDLDALHDVLGGNRKEIADALKALTTIPKATADEPEPRAMIEIDGEDGARRLTIPSWEAWNSGQETPGSSTARSRRHRQRAPEPRPVSGGAAGNIVENENEPPMQRPLHSLQTTPQRSSNDAATRYRGEERRREEIREEEDLPPASAGGAAAPSVAPPVVVFSPTPGAAPQMSLLGEPEPPPTGKPKKGKPREPTPPAPSTEVKGIWQTVWAEAGMSGPAPWGADTAAVAKRYLEEPGASLETARQAIVGMLRTQAGEWHRTHENGKHLGIPAALAGKNVVAFTNAGKAWLAAKEAAARPKRVPPPPDPIPEFARRLYEQDMARKAAEQAPEPETFPEAS